MSRHLYILKLLNIPMFFNMYAISNISVTEITEYIELNFEIIKINFLLITIPKKRKNKEIENFT